MIAMNTVDLEQNTEAWLEWRSHGIGASDVPTIQGNSPWKTPYQLWQEKTGLVEAPDLSGNPNVQRGNNFEEEANSCFEEKYGVFALPVCGQGQGEAAHVRVSYDGLFTKNGGVVNLEIKCPSDSSLKRLEERLSKAALEDVEGVTVREDGACVSQAGLEALGFGHYYDQVQYQMMLAGASITALWIYNVNTKKGTALWIHADENGWESMLEKVNEFWTKVLTQTPPELDPERDVVTADKLKGNAKDAFIEAELSYLEAEKELKNLKEKKAAIDKAMAEARDEMVAQMGNYGRAEGLHGAKVARFYRRGNIDWKQAFNEVAPDFDEKALEAYRKKGADTVRVTTSKPASA